MAEVTPRNRVLEALRTEPSLDASGMGVATRNSVVTLTGSVGSLGERALAEHITAAIDGVTAVENMLSVDLPDEAWRVDADLIADVEGLLARTPGVPATRIRVEVLGGWLLLAGQVDRSEERDAAERCVLLLPGLRGISNEIHLAAPEDLMPWLGAIS